MLRHARKRVPRPRSGPTGRSALIGRALLPPMVKDGEAFERRRFAPAQYEERRYKRRNRPEISGDESRNGLSRSGPHRQPLRRCVPARGRSHATCHRSVNLPGSAPGAQFQPLHGAFDRNRIPHVGRRRLGLRRYEPALIPGRACRCAGLLPCGKGAAIASRSPIGPTIMNTSASVEDDPCRTVAPSTDRTFCIPTCSA